VKGSFLFHIVNYLYCDLLYKQRHVQGNTVLQIYCIYSSTTAVQICSTHSGQWRGGWRPSYIRDPSHDWLYRYSACKNPDPSDPCNEATAPLGIPYSTCI